MVGKLINDELRKGLLSYFDREQYLERLKERYTRISARKSITAKALEKFMTQIRDDKTIMICLFEFTRSRYNLGNIARFPHTDYRKQEINLFLSYDGYFLSTDRDLSFRDSYFSGPQPSSITEFLLRKEVDVYANAVTRVKKRLEHFVFKFLKAKNDE